MLSDAELARAAQSGDVTCLGILLERHRAALYALALRMLRRPPDAQDAVHDAFLVALRNIDRLREPETVGAWLRGIVRNVCLRQLRSRRSELFVDEVSPQLELRLAESPVEEALDQLALREWVWAALAELPETLRVTAMLRYFGSYTSYEEIAVILEVPVGTVRSRLHQVKIRLAEALLRTAGLASDADDEASRLTEHVACMFVDGMKTLNRGELSSTYLSMFAEDVTGAFGEWPFQGRRMFEWALRQNIVDGVKVHPTSALTSPGVIVLEATFENPPDGPSHCPPAMAWVTLLGDGKAQRTRVHHAPRPPEQRQDDAVELRTA